MSRGFLLLRRHGQHHCQRVSGGNLVSPNAHAERGKGVGGAVANVIERAAPAIEGDERTEACITAASLRSAVRVTG